ncbi:phage minor capsid protein [Pediococcus pentosaceus]|uniref:phage minor capsid protein n=1 Tax=Pediococcus pentosaceus TaxID=1255 RepID=UPI00211C0290|nr:phage minor capsid protein [Pediococcus pentosaceus]MCQ9315325.1 phage minor capsid protein [Pediococcus pentosaceus]MCQ9337837.1 phage minor capsid protein [Pediococcus pentosaceus]
MATPQQLKDQASNIAGIYSDLQDEILKQIIKRLNDDSLAKMKRDDVLKWQVQKMSELHLLNEDTLDYISKSVSKSHKAVKELLSNISKTAVNNVDGDLQRATGKEKQPMNSVEQVLNAYSNQTMGEVNNNVNQSLISSNFDDTAQAQAYTDIINKTVAKVVTGLKSPQQALADTVYQWQNQGGLKSGFVDKGGHHWTLQGYANTVIQSTVPRTYGAITKQRMDDYDYHLVLYPAHLSAREACAPIQGLVVNMVPPSDSKFDPNYDTVYNHGYGTAGGALGINCSHWNFTVFVPGVSTNNLHPVDPDTAIANAKIQQDQRRMERAIRQSKSKLQAAEELGDQDGIKHFKLQIRNQQAAVRQLVKKHDFLSREYSREKVYGQPKTVKTELKSSVKGSDIINAFDKANIKEAFGDKYYSQFKNSISSLKDEQLRKLYAKYGQDLEFADVTKAANNRAFADGHTVHLSDSSFEGSEINEPMQTVFHEIGHAIDSTSMNDIFGKQGVQTGRQIKRRLAGRMHAFNEMAYHVTGDPKVDLGNTIKQDLFDYINHGKAKSPMQMGKKPRKKAEKAIWMEEDSKSWEGVEKIRQFIRDTKPTALKNMRKYSDVSDIIDGTRYYTFDYPWRVGHESKYWNNYGTQETEFFAEYTSSRATNPASLALIKEIFPNAAKICDSLIDAMVEAKK